METSLEIACDESGWEGTNLAAANSELIAHASVRLDMAAAADCMRALRARSGRQNYEFKASHLRKVAQGAEVAGFLGPAGPVHGRARIHLTHKSCFIVSRLLDLFIGGSVDAASLGLRPDPRLARIAATLCRTGPATYGPAPWRAFLQAANMVLRPDRQRRVQVPVDAFYDQVDVLGGGEILDELRDQRPHAYAARSRLLDDRPEQPVLEPLIPAVTRAVLHWSRGEEPIAVIHDEQSALTERRMQRLEQILAGPPLELIRVPVGGRFIRFRQGDSKADPRIQIADLLAGVARNIATDQLHGRADPELATLLCPYIDPSSRWCI